MNALESTINSFLPSAALYIRGSTEEQQNTLGAQRTQLEHYCALKSLAGQAFVDEGQSATSTDFLDRPKVREMLAWMQQTGATEIVITKLDRGFRGAVDMLESLRLLAERGFHLHLLDLGIDPTTPIGKLIATILAAVARFECDRKSERQRDAFSQMRAEKQRTGAVSYGWDALAACRTSKTGRAAENLVVNPREMAVLRQILFWHAQGDSDCSIARQLNLAGIPTKSAGKTLSRNGKTWVCDGQWKAGHVLSIRQHALLPETTPATQVA